MALRPLLARAFDHFCSASVVAQRCVFTSSRQCQTDKDSLALSKLQRGTGGHSSFNGRVVTLFGSTSLLGRVVLTHLAKTGTQVIIPYNCEPYFIRDMKVVGDLGQILFMPFHLDDEESLRHAMRYSDTVINLIGKDHDTRNFTLEEVNVAGAARIARISREMNVDRLVHISALSQHPNPPRFFWKPSRFRKTKAEGEAAVREERPDAIIFRPSDIFGDQDKFLCYYAAKPRRYGYGRKCSVSLWKLGRETVKQPVFIGDVARGIVNSLTAPEAPGQIYEAVGPHRYRLDDLVKWIYFICRWLPVELEIVRMNPSFLTRMIVNQYFARVNPFLTLERYEREFATDELSGNPTLTDLGVNLTKLEDRIHHILYLYRRYNIYWDAVGEFPEPPNPPLQPSTS